MSLLSNLRKRQSERFATATPATVATRGGEKARTVATVATVSVANATEAKTPSAASLPEDEAPFAAHSPPRQHVTGDSGSAKASTSCSTCAHVTGRGGCGEPVEAGLSAQVGVIRYHPHDGAGCLAWMAVIQPVLEQLTTRDDAFWDFTSPRIKPDP